MQGTHYRIGSGIDFHQLVVGRKLWLGGIEVPHYKGALGHSDADVLLHAICDALLGALALGDIGKHFPDTDAAYKNIDSKILLQRTADLIRSNGYSVVNVDAALCLEKPKIKPYVASMQQCIAGILQLTPADVSIKATTTETMGFTGREEGVVAIATVLLKALSAPLPVKVVNQSSWPLPAYATAGSSGLDLRANIAEPLRLQSLESAQIPTGLFLEIPLGYEAQIRPRSGLAARQGITVLNAPGTIDSDYRGEVQVLLINLSGQPQEIAPGERMAQIVFQPITHITWQTADTLLPSGRGKGGFGHSGKN